MASYQKAATLRAAAILTTSEVKTANLLLADVDGGRVTVHLNFTKGSLTNGIFSFYASEDGVTFTPIEIAGTVSRTFTADTNQIVTFEAPGRAMIAIGVTGTGTVTSSSCTIVARWLKRGSQR